MKAKQSTMRWEGVLPAITTPFRADGQVDHEFLRRHARWLVDHGCTGVVALGSLGESPTLRFEEKVAILRTVVDALKGRAAVVAGIGTLSTAEAVELAREAESIRCSGLMILPPYVYAGDAREMLSHVESVLRSSGLSGMLYNNPIAYRTDFLPEQIAQLAERNPNLHAVKESSGDVRRITALRALCGERLALLVGVDDLIVEGVRAGAVGWIAGLANALPRESVALFELARRGPESRLETLYQWFLPLLRLDTSNKFVQLIKLVQQETGTGSERVRPPRLPLAGAERKRALELIRRCLAQRPKDATACTRSRP
ncbi:dihydrodipicolinate synthase family protein [Limisphaera sp. VF-2]|jgi:dihydrodipicolinate synthase/N-acetylneuraminate lyase|uniref:dihydrodipicolinate synthase family protein n=1 Tax=Limisphaera sp. VF-2 TaxID=3400418 RepID=UPI0030AD9CB4